MTGAEGTGLALARDILTAAFLLLGSGFLLLAAIGVYRLPDLFLRMQSLTKAATLGISAIALALGLHFGRLESAITAGLLVAFYALTAPVAAHVVGRAAYRAGVPLWEGTWIDELGGRPQDPGPLAEEE